jgi:hypothetical protein
MPLGTSRGNTPQCTTAREQSGWRHTALIIRARRHCRGVRRARGARVGGGARAPAVELSAPAARHAVLIESPVRGLHPSRPSESARFPVAIRVGRLPGCLPGRHPSRPRHLSRPPSRAPSELAAFPGAIRVGRLPGRHPSQPPFPGAIRVS